MNRKLEHLIGLPLNLLTLGLYRALALQVHHEMVDENPLCAIVATASFLEFKRGFEKVDWEVGLYHRNSLFDDESGSSFHASVIRINSIGYKLTSYGFFRANILRRKKSRELREARYH